LKRAQWQLVRKQGIDRITWTYDPLLSRNAHLNVNRLGTVCNIYQREVYGEMRDGLNIGLASDRFEVDWWVNSQRVKKRLSTKVRPKLDLNHFLAAGTEILNPVQLNDNGWAVPSDPHDFRYDLQSADATPNLLLVEIPPDFQALKNADMELAKKWRLVSRILFETLFDWGYLVTDFVYHREHFPRSFYVLSYGEGTL
jgi:predicted GNAT superfamily acetyltransferase